MPPPHTRTQTPQELLAALPALSHLSLFKHRDFGDEPLARAALHMTGLSSLDLRGTWVTGAGVGALAALPALQRLALSTPVELRPAAGAGLGALTQLTALALACGEYAPELMAAVAGLTRLKVRRRCRCLRLFCCMQFMTVLLCCPGLQLCAVWPRQPAACPCIQYSRIPCNETPPSPLPRRS